MKSRPVQKWRKMRERGRASLKSLLSAPEAKGDLTLPPRGQLRRRSPSVTVRRKSAV
jgi:antitoxin Phd